jgi:hypothetical protein
VYTRHEGQALVINRRAHDQHMYLNPEFMSLTKTHYTPPNIHLYAVDAYMPRKPPTHLPEPDYWSAKDLANKSWLLTSEFPPTSLVPLDGKLCNSFDPEVPLVQILEHPSLNLIRIGICP